MPRASWARAMNARPGMLIGDSLRLDRHLSDGGMATLWLAEHLRLGESVVVKFLSPKIADQPNVVDRLRREAEITSRLRDPHIVRVYEFVDAPPAPYLVMERLEGEDLATRLAWRGPHTVDETCEIVQQAASALEVAHAVGVVHRDVKPENIFLTESEGRLLVKLLDFGLARVDGCLAETPRLTGVGVTVGTPLYMSPEQLLDPTSVDARCDVWSLAVVAYACLAGRAPLEGKALASMGAALQACEFDPPSRWRPDLPPAVDAFFARALHERIAERPSSPAALSAALMAVNAETPSIHDGLDLETDELAFPLVHRIRRDTESAFSVPRLIDPRRLPASRAAAPR
jgi:eukaryotic-like serine/threonine-protein kinase